MFWWIVAGVGTVCVLVGKSGAKRHEFTKYICDLFCKTDSRFLSSRIEDSDIPELIDAIRHGESEYYRELEDLVEKKYITSVQANLKMEKSKKQIECLVELLIQIEGEITDDKIKHILQVLKKL